MASTWLRRRIARHRRADRWAAVLRVAALTVALAGVLASVLVARGWQDTVTRQRDERLDRTKTARTVTIRSALGQYENALQAARSLWLASDHVGSRNFGTF